MAQRRMSSLASPFELMTPRALDVNAITETLNRMFPSLQLIPSDIQKPTVSIISSISMRNIKYEGFMLRLRCIS
ncbi:unnamed protein product [Brugia timori]|uniref:Cytochrome P450 n=1 Tax=Brugia timori TaxID=42155 RepID=A0A0R3QHM8_9BILA|nr:unnamed protein product [Brugia timori]